MNRDDIIRMAREAGFERIIGVYKDGTRMVEVPHPELLERFAALVAAAEGEAIIQAIPGGHFVDPQWVCDMIRARNNA